ncbi:MAG: hypothetical protein FJ271_04220 [Planctomycetes bacterium]|nr:hypothetical protein [Planctomycetota bacterium]
MYWLAWPLAIIGLCILPVAVIGVLGLGDRFWSNVIDKKSAKGKHKLFKPVEASQPWPAWLKDACAGVGAFVLVVGMVVLVGAFGGFIYIACRSVFLKEVGSIGPIAVDDNVTRWHSTSEWGRFLQGAWWTIRVLLPIFALMTVFAPARGEENPYHSIFDSLRGKNTSCDRSREMAICRSAGIGMAILAFILWVSLPSAVTGTWELTPDGFGTPDQTYVWKDIRAIAFRGNNIEVTTAAGTDKQTRPQSMALVKLEKKEESNVQAWSQHLSRFAPKVQLAVEFSEMSRDRKVITRTEILFPSSGNPKAKAGG